MTKDEIKTKLDALSPAAKEWLHNACNQIADAGEYIDRPVDRKECIAAGLVEMHGRMVDVDAHVMGLVSDNYLAAEVLPNNPGQK